MQIYSGECNTFVSERKVSWGNLIPKIIPLFPRLVAKLH